MGIINVQTVQAGLVDVLPSLAYIETNDPLATVLVAGYLNHVVQNGTSFQLPCIAAVSTKETPTSAARIGWFAISHSGANWSLVSASSPAAGVVTLPTILNHIAIYSDTSGTLAEDAATAINGGNIQAGLSGTAGYLASFPATAASGSLRLTAVANTGNTLVTISNALHGQASVYSIPDSGAATANFIMSASAGTQAITSGGLQVSAGNLTAGASGAAGTLISFPATAANGSLIVSALNAGGAFNTTVRNSVMGQSSVISIPDPGAATANFLLDTGASNILAQQQFVGLSNVLTFGTGTWTVTRVAQGNYVSRHTAGDETSIIAVDITPIIRVAASKGWRLDSFDYIYSIATLAMDAHTLTLDRIAYANNVAVSVTSIPVTATLATATQANPYLTNCTVTTPAFDVTADSKYVIEITANNALTTDFDYYGIMLRFSQTVA